MNTTEQPTDASTPDTLSGSLIAVAKALETGAPNESLVPIGDILASVPGQPQALLLLSSAFRLMNEPAGAREVLEILTGEHPQLASIRFELGLLLGRQGLHREAIEQLSRVVELEPNHPAAWRALGNQLALTGDAPGANKAYARHVRTSLKELRLLEDAVMGPDSDLDRAEKMLIQYLAVNPTDVSVVHMLADVGMRQDRHQVARGLLEKALELVPDFHAARLSYAQVLNREFKWHDAIRQLDIVLKADPDNARAKVQKAWNLVMLGEYQEAETLLEAARPKLENEAGFWINYGHFLRTIGRSKECVDAYRRCTELDPSMGLAWWSLANLKTYRFSPSEIDTMRQQIRSGGIGDSEQLCHLEFSLGAALESAKAYPESFEHYRQGNALRRSRLRHDVDDPERKLKSAKALFTRDFFKARSGLGCPAPDPIFIVGMPRAGSTLIEQILSSHSEVEGTAELPDMSNIVSELQGGGEKAFPELLAKLDAADFERLGEKYLETTRFQRKTGRPYFTDKSPQNFLHVGLIQLILPNAKIIDARRHPLSCCFSGYKQCFPPGSMVHTYDLAEIGRYYRHYVELMAHFDAVLPGRVHRVFHESMVRNPESEIRRLLEYCRLPFEEGCLRFYETDRGVRTASSEQVRRPVFAEAVEPWTHYEAWLGPLRKGLGDVLDIYPDVPKFGGVPAAAR